MGLFSLIDLQLVNFLTLVTEFAAISLALGHNISPNLGVPLAALILIVMVLSGSYRRWERVTVFLCLLDLAWVAIAFKVRPHIGEILHSTLIPGVPRGGLSASLMFLIIAIVGTTIAPWQLFFQQSCIADKRLRFSDLKWARLDTFLGAVFTIIVAGCMMLAGNAGRRKTKMACITLIAPMAVATTQLARIVRYEQPSSASQEKGLEHTLLRMSWVVAIDGDGKQKLQMQWCSSTQARGCGALTGNIPLMRAAYLKKGCPNSCAALGWENS